MAEAFGAELRYRKRIARWGRAPQVLPRLRHDAWWIVHNAIAHPVIGVWPSSPTIWLHDWTSQRLDRRRTRVRSVAPVISARAAWIEHDVLAHLAIARFPSAFTFRWHDRTAVEMNVPDWI